MIEVLLARWGSDDAGSLWPEQLEVEREGAAVLEVAPHGQDRSSVFMMWWSLDFCGPQSVQRWVYVIRAGLCQELWCVPKLGFICASFLMALESARMPSGVKMWGDERISLR